MSMFSRVVWSRALRVAGYATLYRAVALSNGRVLFEKVEGYDALGIPRWESTSPPEEFFRDAVEAMVTLDGEDPTIILRPDEVQDVPMPAPEEVRSYHRPRRRSAFRRALSVMTGGLL